MPSMANITVKKADGTTDIVYDALAASAGDSSPAVWRQDTGATAALPVGLRALLRALTRWNGQKTARVMETHYQRPYAVQDSTTTLYSAKDQVIIDVRAVVPQSIPATEINEAIAQGLNLAASTLIKQVGQTGFSPS